MNTPTVSQMNGLVDTEQELGIMFDRRAGGTEVIGGAHKWVMNEIRRRGFGPTSWYTGRSSSTVRTCS
ncbi:MAG TPA: hypothetical protein VIH18_26090 [Candidatus Binatia bacterium]|jgi:hypothetical protein